MRVEFAPSGVGLGHAGRCIPIARGLAEKRNDVEVFFSTYLDAVDYVRKEGFPVAEVPPMDFKVKPDGSVDFRRTAISPGPFVAPFSFLEQVRREIEIMGVFKPDVVVSDSRASPIVAARILNIPSLCMLNQFQVIIPRTTHYLRLAKFADAMTLAIIGKVWTTGTTVMIPDFAPPYAISSANLRMPKVYRRKIRFIGPILPVRPDALPPQKEVRRKLQLQEEKPMIFVPVSGPSKERSYLISVLQKIFTRFPDDYQIVMSLGSPDSSSPSPVNYGNLMVFNWIPNRFEYLKACDIVISRAGHGTVLQNICYGKPAILVPTPNHTEQLSNAGKAAKLGAAVAVDQERLSKETLEVALEKILKESSIRDTTVALQREVHALDGLETAVETTMGLVEA